MRRYGFWVLLVVVLLVGLVMVLTDRSRSVCSCSRFEERARVVD
jgi:hypothetical protein